MDKAGRVGGIVGDKASIHITCFDLGTGPFSTVPNHVQL